jgi:hypothetical protein
MSAPKFSGIQMDVFKLYRALQRTARAKDSSGELGKFVCQQFREKAMSLKKTDFKLIEHMLRWGVKQKKLIEMPGFSVASVVKPKNEGSTQLSH